MRLMAGGSTCSLLQLSVSCVSLTSALQLLGRSSSWLSSSRRHCSNQEACI
jgi:hypothetical protein